MNNTDTRHYADTLTGEFAPLIDALPFCKDMIVGEISSPDKTVECNAKTVYSHKRPDGSPTLNELYPRGTIQITEIIREDAMREAHLEKMMKEQAQPLSDVKWGERGQIL